MVAVIIALPSDFAVIVPFSSIVATFSLLDFQSTIWLASSGKILAASVRVSIPASRSIPTILFVTITSSSRFVFPSGIIISKVFTASVTFTGNVSEAPPPSAAVAVISATPLLIPVTSPVFLSTVAIDVSSDSQQTALFSADFGKTSAFSFIFPPFATLLLPVIVIEDTSDETFIVTDAVTPLPSAAVAIISVFPYPFTVTVQLPSL